MLLDLRPFLSSLLVLFLSPIAHGFLGEKVAPGTGSPATLKSNSVSGLSAKVVNAPYTVLETEIETGTIKEYINNDGIVFAVSWRGMAQPDFSQILGSYFAEYKNTLAQKRNRNSKTPSTVKVSDAVIYKGGHMRDVRGLAVLPNLLPDGVRAEDLQ